MDAEICLKAFGRGDNTIFQELNSCNEGKLSLIGNYQFLLKEEGYSLLHALVGWLVFRSMNL